VEKIEATIGKNDSLLGVSLSDAGRLGLKHDLV
jgi:hypothetical protein